MCKIRANILLRSRESRDQNNSSLISKPIFLDQTELFKNHSMWKMKLYVSPMAALDNVGIRGCYHLERDLEKDKIWKSDSYRVRSRGYTIAPSLHRQYEKTNVLRKEFVWSLIHAEIGFSSRQKPECETSGVSDSSTYDPSSKIGSEFQLRMRSSRSWETCRSRRLRIKRILTGMYHLTHRAQPGSDGIHAIILRRIPQDDAFASESHLLGVCVGMLARRGRGIRGSPEA